MSLLERQISPDLARWESSIVCLMAWMVLVSIPLALGGIGLSWDALNHHIYLGWVADAPRFDRDVLAASYQSYQFPYLYWPVYKMAMAGWSGISAGAVLATLHVLAVPPLWLLARACIPGDTVFDISLRALAVVLAFCSGLVLSMFETTFNDLMAAIPMVWALALAIEPVSNRHKEWMTQTRKILLSGALAGIAVAFKLSNGPLVLLLPGIWFWVSCGHLAQRLRSLILGGLAVGVSFIVTYGYWGLQLWEQFGNPVYPFYDQHFAANSSFGGPAALIRFLPDTWLDALLRPVAMAMPDGWIYTEIMAPDLRFVYVLLLLILLLPALALRRKISLTSCNPLFLLLTVTAAAFVLWMLTTGNGRYFFAFLLMVGPLCMALVYRLPMTQGFRLTLAVGLIGVQGLVMHESSPFGVWVYAQWSSAPYFQVDVPPNMKTQTKSYVTLSAISYSLIAPQFSPASRWMNLNEAPSDGTVSALRKKVHSFLASGGDRLTLLVPSLPSHATRQGLPDAEAIQALRALLSEYRISIDQPARCSLMHSNGALAIAKINPKTDTEEKAKKIGFWVCPLRYPTAAQAVQHEIEGSRFDSVFDKVEALCPRFFPPKSAKTLLIDNGELRHYKGTDMKVYVWSDGTVMYRYFRSYSSEMIGTTAEVLSGKATLDCDKLRGRSGLPWERGI